jgi:hypothetical protein
MPDNYFTTDPDLGVDMAPNFPPARVIFRGPEFVTFTNRYGCFDHDRLVENDYILVIGDSATWGYASLEDKWTTRLEELSGRQVLKCGVSGTGPMHQYIKAERTIQKTGKSPSVIIVLYNGHNDFNDDIVFPGYDIVKGQRVNNLKSLDLRSGELLRYTQAEHEERYNRYKSRNNSASLKAKVMEYLKRHSVIVALISHNRNRRSRQENYTPVKKGPILTSRYGFHLWQVNTKEYPWVRQALDDHFNNILQFSNLADLYNADLILFSRNLGGNELKEELRRKLGETLPYYYDVTDEVRTLAKDQRTGWRYDGHWNILGNRLVADVMYRYLTENNIL